MVAAGQKTWVSAAAPRVIGPMRVASSAVYAALNATTMPPSRLCGRPMRNFPLLDKSESEGSGINY